MFWQITIIGLIIGCTGHITTVNATDAGQDIYNHILDNFDTLSEEKTMERTMEQLQTTNSYTQEDVHQFLRGEIPQLKSEMSQEQLLTNKTNVLTTYQFEQQLSEYETSLQTEVSAYGQYANGSLDDSPFDLVVDMNKLDVIYFGEKATMPIAYWSSPSDNNTLNNNNNNNSQSTNTNINNDVSNHNINAGNTNANPEEGSGNTNTQSAPISSPLPINPCPDEATLLKDSSMLFAMQSDIAAIQKKVDSIKKNKQNTGISISLSTLNEKSVPLIKKTYEEIKLPSKQDSGYSSEKSEEGSKEWPCTSLFCITTQAKKGTSQTSYSSKDNSVQSHVEYILQWLQNIGQYNISPKTTSRGFFDIGTNRINFADHFHIDIIVSKRPVQTPGKRVSLSAQPQKIEEAIINKLSYCSGDAEKPQEKEPQQEITEGALVQCSDSQENCQKKIITALTERNACIKNVYAQSSVAIKIANSMNDLDSFQGQFVTMQNMFDAFQEHFSDTTKGILFFTQQFLKNKEVQ